MEIPQPSDHPDDPLDRRTPEEQRRDAEIATLTALCESNRILWAFRQRGHENPSTLDQIAGLLDLPATALARAFLQDRFDYYLKMGFLDEPEPSRYRVNLLRWKSRLRGPA